MLRGLLLLTAFCGAALCTATPTEPLRICVQYEAKVPGAGRKALARELKLLFRGRPIDVQHSGCVRTAEVTLTVRDRRPRLPNDVLGLAVTNEDRVAPSLEVFLAPVIETTGAGSWDHLGRALARVAGHELLHYLLQRTDHDVDGFFRERLTAEYLLRRQVRPVLITANTGGD